jgi:hypothetical protein
MAEGFVYILRNPYLVSPSGRPVVKIGGTGRRAEKRALELSAATGVPGPYTVAFATRIADWQRLEAMVHRALRRFQRGGEFYEIDIDEAITCIKELKAKLTGETTTAHPGRSIIDPDVAADVRFRKTQTGLAVRVEGELVGHLEIGERQARYRFIGGSHMEAILEAEILRLSPWQRAGVPEAGLRYARRRAAWIATLLKRFTTPAFEPLPPDPAHLVRLNGLPVAVVTERRLLMAGRDVLAYELEFVPCPDSPRLEEDFGARVTITPKQPLSIERVIVCIEDLGLEECVRANLHDRMFAGVWMAQARWVFRAELPNCSVDLVLDAKSLPPPRGG